MGLYLIAETWLNWWLNPHTWLMIVEVAFGLGLLIFIHELGHFVVAKLCGVKCEKFYLGFDIAGLKIFSFRWGETEYGIGILPLGGYVKMLGQDDNPARAEEERQRTLAAPAPPEEPGAQAATQQPAALDPRSYTAKSVPQRMAIISAGVIMNMVLAVILATIAYGLGVKEVACGVSEVLPGEAAWRAGMRPGDKILQIGGVQPVGPLTFNDLVSAVAVGNIEEGVRFQVQRPGVDEPFWLTVKPDRAEKTHRGRPMIGAVPPRILTLDEERPVREGSAAAKAFKFKGNDTILEIDGVKLTDYAQLVAQLAQHPGDPLKVTVERKAEKSEAAENEIAKPLPPVDMPPEHMRTPGLVMKMGQITAIAADSPAEAAGLKIDDEILQIDGQAVGDPMMLPEKLRQLGVAGKNVKITVSRRSAQGRTESVTLDATPRNPSWYETPLAMGNPLSAPALGIGYQVSNVVDRVEEDSPAASATLKSDKSAQAGRIKPGDVITKAEFITADDDARSEEAKHGALEVEFGQEKPNWPYFVARIQRMLPETQLKLTLSDSRTTELEAVAARDWFNPDRGFITEADLIPVRAESTRQAIVMGARKARDSALVVFSFLRALFTRQVSTDNLGGVGSIATIAAYSAKEGISQLLMFLTMLSANLAVINILPIPVLDGGHMVFLAWEGIRGKPPSEKVLVGLTYAGLAFILLLMIYVNALDVKRLINWLMPW